MGGPKISQFLLSLTLNHEQGTVDHCAPKKSKLSQKDVGQNGQTKWSNIFSRFIKNILANLVRPFRPPQKLWNLTTVIMVWLNLPAKTRTEFFFTCKNSRPILSKNFSGDMEILRWRVWSDQSGHCKIHLNWQREHNSCTGSNSNLDYIAAIMLR